MRVISLWEPWASLMAHGKKRVETRSWRFPYPLPAVMAIHAAKKWSREFDALCASEPFASTLDDCGLTVGKYGRGLPLGCIVAIGKLAAVRQSANFSEGPDYCSYAGGFSIKVPKLELAFGDYSAGRWGWIFERVVRLETPVPARGAQGLWTWTPDAGTEGARIEAELSKIAAEAAR